MGIQFLVTSCILKGIVLTLHKEVHQSNPFSCIPLQVGVKFDHRQLCTLENMDLGTNHPEARSDFETIGDLTKLYSVKSIYYGVSNKTLLKEKLITSL